MLELTTEHATAAFWDRYPCDGQDTLTARARVRANKHPWLAAQLNQIAEQHARIVEIKSCFPSFQMWPSNNEKSFGWCGPRNHRQNGLRTP
jgi:hypothetical protein